MVSSSTVSEPNDDYLLTAYVQIIKFIELTESGRFSLLQVYIAALAASITVGAALFTYGWEKNEPLTLFIPLVMIFLFLAFLSIALYHVFIRWDATYAYNMASLEWISEKLKMARKMPEDKRKKLCEEYSEKVSKKYGKFLKVIPLPGRKYLPEWSMIDEVYGPIPPPASISAHPWFNRLLLVCAASFLSVSTLLILHLTFHPYGAEMLLLGTLVFTTFSVILFEYNRKLYGKIDDEVELFKEFRKPSGIEISGSGREVCKTSPREPKGK